MKTCEGTLANILAQPEYFCVLGVKGLELQLNFMELFASLLHILVPGTVFRIRFRIQRPQMNTVPTSSVSATLVRRALHVTTIGIPYLRWDDSNDGMLTIHIILL